MPKPLIDLRNNTLVQGLKRGLQQTIERRREENRIYQEEYAKSKQLYDEEFKKSKIHALRLRARREGRAAGMGRKVPGWLGNLQENVRRQEAERQRILSENRQNFLSSDVFGLNKVGLKPYNTPLYPAKKKYRK